MSAHRVFVIWIHPLFLASLRMLLKDEHIQWAGACRSSDEGYAAVRELAPDTILIEEEENGRLPANLGDLLEGSAANVRIFRLGLADNDLQIYHRERRTVMQANDLLNLIREGE